VARTEDVGLLFLKNQLQIEPKELDGIVKWPISMTMKEVKSSLQLGNFNKEFIQNYRDLMKTLNKLLKTDKEFIWNEKQQETLKRLAKEFQRSSMLMPDP
jgi:ketol-acid reductoisomerase